MANLSKIIFILVVFVLAGTSLSAQDALKSKSYNREFCSETWSNGDKYGAKDLREFKLSAGSLTVDGKRNGGISVKGEDRSDILVRACVQSWAETEQEAQSAVKAVRIDIGGVVAADSPGGEKNWSVSYQIAVPRGTNLKLTTLNGGISISDVDGNIEFEARNGGVNLANLAGDVRGKTANGGVNVKLDGNSWKGTGLNVETTNGGVKLAMSESYAARIETGTVNGGFSSDIPALKVEKEDGDRYYNSKKRVTADLNGGGAIIRVVTTNGGVSIRSTSQSRDW